MTDELQRAAQGGDGPFAHAVRTAEQRAADKAARKAARAAERSHVEQAAAEVQPPVDPIAAAQELLARSGEIDTAYGVFHQQRDAALEREQECLETYRRLHEHNRHRINDARWCATSEGQLVNGALEALRDEVNRLSGIKPTDPDYKLLWMARIAVYHADLIACVLEAALPLISAQGNAAPVLVAIDKAQERALMQQAQLAAAVKQRKGRGKERSKQGRNPLERFFFRVRTPDGGPQTFYPNDYEHRPEVRRVVRELQQLRRRSILSFVRERKQTEMLLTTFAPDRADDAGNPLDFVRLLSIAEPSPYGDAHVEVALYIGGFRFVPPSEMQPRLHGGVVHLAVENSIDTVTGEPAKRVTVVEIVGTIERVLPAAGVCWSIVLGRDGEGELGLRKGRNRIEDRQPFALLRHIQQECFEASRCGQTIGQVFGIEAFNAYQERRQARRRGPAAGGNGVPKGAPQAEPAPDAVVAATEPPAGGDETPAS